MLLRVAVATESLKSEAPVPESTRHVYSALR